MFPSPRAPNEDRNENSDKVAADTGGFMRSSCLLQEHLRAWLVGIPHRLVHAFPSVNQGLYPGCKRRSMGLNEGAKGGDKRRVSDPDELLGDVEGEAREDGVGGKGP